MQGKVHSIESLGTLDGPGIRTVVFMQGCPLKCKFCHNIDCVTLSDKNIYNPADLATKLLKNQAYWISDRVDGGVTFSGGEPLMQASFINETAVILKQNNAHTAIDTSLFGNSESIRNLLPLVDLWMVSIKELDPLKHKELTGVDNTIILKNLDLLDNSTESDNIRIRYLVIPTLTDSLYYQNKMIAFCKKIRHLESVEILAYGTHGKHKWLEIYGEYPLEGIPSSSKAQIREIATHFKQNGLRIKY